MKKRVKPDPYMTDEENPEWTADDFLRARPAREVVPDIVAAYERGELRMPGRPRGSNKTTISVRLDNRVLDFFKSKGPRWQTRMNAALRAIVEAAG